MYIGPVSVERVVDPSEDTHQESSVNVGHNSNTYTDSMYITTSIYIYMCIYFYIIYILLYIYIAEDRNYYIYVRLFLLCEM